MLEGVERLIDLTGFQSSLDVAPKRDAVLRTYYETPDHEHVLCVDEKTQMLARERRFLDTPKIGRAHV